MCGLCIGTVLGSGPHESAFVSACFSLSSTPLIARFLSTGSSGQEDGNNNSDKYNDIVFIFFKLTKSDVLHNYSNKLYIQEY